MDGPLNRFPSYFRTWREEVGVDAAMTVQFFSTCLSALFLSKITSIFSFNQVLLSQANTSSVGA